MGLATSRRAALASARPFAQSLSYSSGQNVSPAYEGWEVGTDGAKYFVFGYMNRNWVEEIDVPVGPENSFNIGGADQGQPTHFLPRRNRFIFRVPVPAGFTDNDELVWTLTTQGKTEKAYASLRLDYQIDDVVRASETGALGAGSSSPEIRANKPPVVEVQGRKSLDREGRRGRRAHRGRHRRRDSEAARLGLVGRRRQQRRLAQRHAGDARQSRDAAARARHRRQERRPARVVVRLSRQGRGDVLARADHVVGRHARRRQLAVGAGVGRAAAAARRQGDGLGDVLEPGTYVLRSRADDGALTADGQVTITVTR